MSDASFEEMRRQRDEARARLEEARRIIADLRAELLQRGKGERDE